MTIIVPRAKLSVDQAPIPGVRVSADVPSGAFNRGAADINKAAQGIFADEKQKADMTAFLDADLKAAKLQSSLEAQYKEQYVGQGAAGAAQDADIEYEKQLAGISAGLSSSQRDLFNRSSSQRRASLNSVLEHHSSSERSKYNAQVTDSYISEARNGAISAAQLYAPGDAVGTTLADQDIELSIQRQDAALLKHSLDNKLGDMWFKNKSDEAKSQTHRAVVDVMLSAGNDLMAKDYFDLHKDEIKGAVDVVHINSALHEGSIRGESQRQHDAIVNSVGDWAERDKKANSISDPEVRTATKQLLDDSFTREKRIRTAVDNEMYIKAASDAEEARDIRAIPPAQWAAMSPAEKTSIEQRIKHVKDGTEPSNDSVVWTEFMMKPIKDLVKMEEADLLKIYRPKLDDAHYDAALNQVSAAKDASAKGNTSHLSSMQTDADSVKNAFLQYVKENKLTNLSSSERDMFMKFSDAAAVEVQKYELKKGQKATDEEKQILVRKVLANEVFINEWGSDPSVPAALVEVNDRGAVYVPINKIPDNRRKGLVNWARSLGVIPQDTPYAEAEKFLAKRLERADGAGQIGADDKAIIGILTDGPVMSATSRRSSAGVIERK